MGSGVKKTRASGTSDFADFGGSAGGLRPLFELWGNSIKRSACARRWDLQTLAEARAASGRFLNYGKQHKKIRVRKTLGLADFGGSAGGLRPLWIRMGLLHMNSPIDTRITAN